MKTTIQFKLRPSKSRANEGIVTAHVTRHRATRTLSTGLRLKKHEWDPLSQEVMIIPETSCQREKELVRIRKELARVRATFQREINRLSQSGDFSANEVMTAYRCHNGERSFCKYLEKKITELEESNRMGTAHCYRSSLNSFMGFREGRDLSMRQVNHKLISNYETYLFGKGNSRNTVSCYMRSLRAAYNQAVAEDIIPAPKVHPFRDVYTGNDKTAKRSIPKTEMAAIAGLGLPAEESGSLRLCRDLFLFSFYTQGMSYTDMIRLRKDNLQGEYLVYRRQKTGQEIRVRLLPCMRTILRNYAGDKDRKHLFPVLSGRAEKKAEWREYTTGLANYNRGLKRIASLLGLSARLTGYVARHTWATCAAEEGIPLSTISRGMGHESEKTTRIYIGTLDNTDVNYANMKVLSFLTNRSEKTNFYAIPKAWKKKKYEEEICCFVSNKYSMCLTHISLFHKHLVAC